MNGICFACYTCHAYIDAGYRWCHFSLEVPGYVQRGALVDVDKVMKAAEYWNGDTNAAWLAQLLPKVSIFLRQHQGHQLIFDEDHNTPAMPTFEGDKHWLDWRDEEGHSQAETPATLRERYGLVSWDQVASHVIALHPDDRPWWWTAPEMLQARAWFETKAWLHSSRPLE